MNKAISLITSLAVASSLTAFSAVSLISLAIKDVSFVDEGIYEFGDDSSLEYKIKKEGELLITKYMGNASEVEIPSEINDQKVNIIANGAFRDCTNLTEVIIPDGTNYLMNNAFTGCANLNKVTIPKSIETFEEDVFLNCGKNLTIYGYRGTLAENYAKDNGFKFFALDVDTTQKNVTNTTASNSNSDSPKTGDNGIFAFAVIGVAAVLFLSASRKRKV